ncbi:MAG TPA: protein-glutamate O-methyltransferase CheR [Anaeromyxobacter sp.]|nr:protein-glutamate O-methyltransferase CheR [Anaeromyxobacter sp.]
MTAALPLAHADEIARALQRACGIVFSDRHGEQLRSGVQRAAEALGVRPDAVLARLRSGDPAAVCALVDGSVVGETYFSRHPEQLSALRDALRRESPGRPLRVWCAGCASGEEAYTVAALLLDDGRSGSSVLGTDVSGKALRAARKGRYGAWSLRALPPALRARWLRPDGGHWTVVPEIHGLVAFERHNLVTEPPPRPAFDVVLCRNVLIYFDRPTADAVIRRLFEAVRPGGLVALAPAENFLAQPLGFEAVEHRGGALWRKAPAPRRASRAAGPAPGPRPPERAPRAPAGEPSHDVARGGRGGARGADGRAGPRASAAPPRGPAEPDVLGPARRAAAEGRLEEAERLATEAGEAALRPEPFLFAAAVADARGDLDGAVRWVGRALFLDPGHAVARASLVPLLERAGRRAEAARARRQALDALAAHPDDALLPGLEPVAAGALRAALAGPGRPEVPW